MVEKPELEASRAGRGARARASTARDLDDGLPRAKDDWGWNWSDTRKALDYLYMAGDLAIAGRNSQFEPLYDLPERVLPAEVLAAPTPSIEDASARAGPPRGRLPRRRPRRSACATTTGCTTTA